MAKNEIKRTQSMMTFLLFHKTAVAFTKDLESLMEGEERLSVRTQEISDILWQQMKESTLVLMVDG